MRDLHFFFLYVIQIEKKKECYAHTVKKRFFELIYKSNIIIITLYLLFI